MSATRNKSSPEFRDRAVRMVNEHRGDYPSERAAMTSIAGKAGCTTETLRRWCREDSRPNASGRPGAVHFGQGQPPCASHELFLEKSI